VAGRYLGRGRKRRQNGIGLPLVVERRFLERAYTTTQVDGTTSSGVQLIGWIRWKAMFSSWNFSADGGTRSGSGFLNQTDGRRKMRGTTGDGTLTTSINHLRKLDDNAYVWQSVQRTVGSMRLADTGEVI